MVGLEVGQARKLAITRCDCMLEVEAEVQPKPWLLRQSPSNRPQSLSKVGHEARARSVGSTQGLPLFCACPLGP